MVPVVPLFSTEHSKRENTGSFSRIKRGKLNVMDKMWDRKPSKSEVIGHNGGSEKNE